MGKISKNIMWILSVLSYAGIIICYPRLPEQIPTYWNLGYEIDGWSNKKIILFLGLLPVIILILCDERLKINNRMNNKKYTKVYGIIKYAAALLLIAFCWISVIIVFVPYVKMEFILRAVLGIFFILLGNYMPALKSNYFIGIRNRWTMSDAYVWRRTHKMGGYLFILFGLLMAVMAFFQSAAVNRVVFELLIIGILGVNMYSYIIYRKIKSNL